ncbi:hypothetical protein [Marinomonas balearica]|uniref:Histidine kinase N-terminal 7TM region domain-containing protein n=1 Tax=Marinomonas balearica TaxID=491947 RepID=A0A4R6M797_9GAMM|nr:hypothetical protein [Marinomonas balearica]TDO97277.1 hypothetical protein DFP79_2094 [Marinomonas balearica]
MIWMLPSAIALSIKCFLFFYSNVVKQKYFFYFLVAAFSLNLSELLGFFRFGYDLIFLKLYYCSAVSTLLFISLTCSEISESRRIIPPIISMITACMLASAILFSNQIISDYVILDNNTATRVAGEYYFLFQLYAVGAISLSIFLLVKNSIRRRGDLTGKRCFIALIAMLPLFLIVPLVITLMQLGYKINAAGFFSLSTCFMLFVFISLNDKHKLFTMMRFIPYSRERKFHLELKALLMKFSLPASGTSVDMKKLIKEIEELVVKHTSQYFNTQKEVAKILNISESSLSRKLPKKE